MRNYKEGSFALGQWVHSQRQKAALLSDDRRKRLDSLGFIWQARDAAWENGFRLLKFYKNREGNCLVPQTHRENGFRLGGWVCEQRTNRDAISDDRLQRLDALGFVWQTREAAWENAIRLLELYKQREEHCLVPQQHKENGFRLGNWVNSTRTRRSGLPKERMQRLEELGFVWKAQ